MKKNNNIFYKCYKYPLQKKINKPLLFYHVPKCGGTTLTVLLSHLFKTQYRVLGPLFHNNDKGGKTAYDLFLNNLKSINNSDVHFLYGHLPFEIEKLLKKKFLTITSIRNPIERCISHYKWMIIRRYCSYEDNLESLFKNNKIAKNTIVNQFSGIGLTKQNTNTCLELAYNNLSKKINFVYDSNNLFQLLKFIISNYDLPNLIFQNYQVILNDKIVLSEKNLKIIKENNQLDIELYSSLLKNKIFKFEQNKLNNNNIEKKFFYSSPELKINNKNSLIIDHNAMKNLEKTLIKKEYIFKEM